MSGGYFGDVAFDDEAAFGCGPDLFDGNTGCAFKQFKPVRGNIQDSQV